MATAAVVSNHEVDQVIAYQKRIEREREEREREFERLRKEREAQRLKGRSHWAVAQHFARGAVKGKGSRVFIEGDKIYSYGHHFVLATRNSEGGWGCGVKFIVNGDRYSVSTSGHTNLVIHACKPNAQIPYSALEAAGLTEYENHSAAPASGLRIVAHEDDSLHPVCNTCGRDVIADEDIHKDGSPICIPSGDERSWRYEHVLGGVVIAHRDKYYLSAVDGNEPWRFRAYFLCELPRPVGSIGDAYAALKPQRVKEAEVAGIPVRRQGDIFLIQTNSKDWNLRLRYGRDTLAANHRLWGGTHIASRALIVDGHIFVSGKLTHERRQHRTVFFKGAWCEAVKNEALASWNAVGNVD